MRLVISDLFQADEGGGTFANKTFANRTFANGESPWVYWRKSTVLSPIGEIPGGALAKVQWTFASCHETILIQDGCQS